MKLTVIQERSLQIFRKISEGYRKERLPNHRIAVWQGTKLFCISAKCPTMRPYCLTRTGPALFKHFQPFIRSLSPTALQIRITVVNVNQNVDIVAMLSILLLCGEPLFVSKVKDKGVLP